VNKWTILLLLLASLSACSTNNKDELDSEAQSELNSPALSVSGTDTLYSGSTQYVFANSVGTMTTSANEIAATFSDPFLPLTMSGTSAFSGAVTSGSCTTLGPFVTSLQGTPADVAVTQMSTSGCSDQAVVTMSLNTANFSDTAGMVGSSTVTTRVTVDVAPEVSQVATGNSSVDGTGTTESSTLYFTLASDASLITTFSKVVTTLTGTLSGCTATLGTGVYVGSTHTTVAWPVNDLTNLNTSSTCLLDVSNVKDGAGNPIDPSDPNRSMTITFH